MGKSVLWMHMTNNKYSKLRQETYILLSTISQLAPSLLIHVPLLPSPLPSLTSSSSLSEQIDSVPPISDTQQQHDKKNKSKTKNSKQNKNKQNQQKQQQSNNKSVLLYSARPLDLMTRLG